MCWPHLIICYSFEEKRPTSFYCLKVHVHIFHFYFTAEFQLKMLSRYGTVYILSLPYRPSVPTLSWHICLNPISNLMTWRTSLSLACLLWDSFAFVFKTRRVTICPRLCLTPRNVNISSGTDAWSRCYVPLKTIFWQASNVRHQVFNGVRLNIYEISLLMGDDKEADICMPDGCPRTAMGREDRRTENQERKNVWRQIEMLRNCLLGVRMITVVRFVQRQDRIVI